MNQASPTPPRTVLRGGWIATPRQPARTPLVRSEQRSPSPDRNLGHELPPVVREADIAVVDGRIVAVGAVGGIADDDVIDCRGCLVTAGLVNTHHHLYQWLTRGRAVDEGLFGWLQTLYPVWARMRPEDVHAAALVGLAELARSGTTTVADHHYLVPGGDDSVFDAIALAAGRVGVRLHLSRGSMDLGERHGGLPPDSVVEETDDILRSCEEVVSRLHDGERVWVNLAPCSPFSVSRELLRESAALAARLGVRLHTHLAETLDEERAALAQYAMRPVAVLEDLGWIAPTTWIAHGIHLDTAEITRLGEAGTGVAHCPSSNGRLGSGICPVPALRKAGAPVGLGVDGAASNEVGALQPELRQALVLARLATGNPGAFGPPDALELATSGGAACLGMPDVGLLVEGARADLAVWDLSDAPDMDDPLAALVLGPGRTVRTLLVAGQRVVDSGALVRVDLPAARQELATRARQLWARR